MQVPPPDAVAQFASAVSAFWRDQRNSGRHIVIFSRHGINFPGFLITTFLCGVHPDRMPLDGALVAFAQARAPGIFSEACVQALSVDFRHTMATAALVSGGRAPQTVLSLPTAAVAPAWASEATKASARRDLVVQKKQKKEVGGGFAGGGATAAPSSSGGGGDGGGGGKRPATDGAMLPPPPPSGGAMPPPPPPPSGVARAPANKRARRGPRGGGRAKAAATAAGAAAAPTAASSSGMAPPPARSAAANTAGGTAAAAEAQAAKPTDAVPSDWSLHLSKSQQKHYYFNRTTNERLWRDDDLPTGWAFVHQSGAQLFFKIGDRAGTETATRPTAAVVAAAAAAPSVAAAAVASAAHASASGRGGGAAGKPRLAAAAADTALALCTLTPSGYMA